MFFEKMFSEANSLVINYHGIEVVCCMKFKKEGRYSITIKEVSSFSKYNQAIIIHIGDLDGQVLVDGHHYERNGKFTQVILSEKKLANKKTTIEVELNNGSFVVCNGSDPIGTGKIWRSLTMGSALTVTSLEDGWHRINCNDFEYDDDFNDLVFEMKVEREGKVLNIFDDCELEI